MVGIAEGIGAIGLGASLIGRIRDGRASKQEIERLAVRYWGCILFELGTNIRDLREALAMNKPNAGPVLRFDIFDAVIGDLCRIDPCPALLSELNTAVSNLKTIEDMFLTNARRDDFRDDWIKHSVSYRDHLEETYELLRESLRDAGKRAYGDREWQTIETTITPPDLETLCPRAP